MTWLARVWSEIWPNLAANILWVPAAAIHHRRLAARIDRHHEQQLAAISHTADPAAPTT